MDYPRLAHFAQIQGTVELQARISAEGAVTTITSKSGHSLLKEAARESLAHWSFTPCVAGDRLCITTIKLIFVIEGQCPLDCKPEITINNPNQVTIRAKRLPPMID
jgi:TonB family protein